MLTPVPPTDCMSAREAASARLDGELSELEAARLEAHVLACPACGAYASAIAGVAAELRAAPLEQPSALPDVSARGIPPLRSSARRRVPVAAAAAAVALVAAVTGISFAVGSVFGAHGAPSRSAARTTDAVFVHQDSTQQHLLAMLNSFEFVPPPQSGPMHAI